MKKKILSFVLTFVMAFSCFSFLAGCGDKNKKNAESGPELGANYKVVLNVPANKTDMGYSIYNIYAESGWSMGDDTSQIRCAGNEKIRFDLQINSGWIVSPAQINNFKVFLSKDNVISNDDVEIEKMESSNVASETLKENFINAYLRPMDAYIESDIPSDVPARSGNKLYFNAETGAKLNMTDAEYEDLSTEVITGLTEITSKSQVNKYCIRSLEQVLTMDYDINRNISYEIDLIPDGTYYILIQANESKSQTLETITRQVKLMIPTISSEPYVSFSDYDGAYGQSGETYTQDNGVDYKIITKPYGSQAKILTTINTDPDEAQYYKIESSGSWTSFPYNGGGRSDVSTMEILNADKSKQHRIMLVDFKGNPGDIQEINLGAPQLKTRQFDVEIKDNNNDDVLISTNINDMGGGEQDTNTYNEKGFELQFLDGETWKEFDYDISSRQYEHYIAANQDFTFRIKFDNSKFSASNYNIAYAITAQPTYTEPQLIGSTTTNQDGVTYITFTTIPKQTGGLEQVTELPIKLIISNVVIV